MSIVGDQPSLSFARSISGLRRTGSSEGNSLKTTLDCEAVILINKPKIIVESFVSVKGGLHDGTL